MTLREQSTLTLDVALLLAVALAQKTNPAHWGTPS